MFMLHSLMRIMGLGGTCMQKKKKKRMEPIMWVVGIIIIIIILWKAFVPITR